MNSRCGHVNSPGDLYCEQCGAVLEAGEEAAKARDLITCSCGQLGAPEDRYCEKCGAVLDAGEEVAGALSGVPSSGNGRTRSRSRGPLGSWPRVALFVLLLAGVVMGVGWQQGVFDTSVPAAVDAGGTTQQASPDQAAETPLNGDGDGLQPRREGGAADNSSRTTTTTTSTTSTSTTTIPSTTSTTVSEPSQGTVGGPYQDRTDSVSFVLDELGYAADDRGYWNPSATLNVLVGAAEGSATGRGQRAFFFVEGEYIGTDSIEDSQGIGVEGRTDDSITLLYLLYREADAACCPTGGEALVTFQWDGELLEPLSPLPPTDGPVYR